MLFTRLLYAFDEAKINLLLSLLEKKDFNKVIFWAVELYESGFEKQLTNYIWKIYYDFYSIFSNIPFYKLTMKETHYLKTKDFKYILQKLYILFQANPYCDVFIIHNMVKKQGTVVSNIENTFKIIEHFYNKKFIYKMYWLIHTSLKFNKKNIKII